MLLKARQGESDGANCCHVYRTDELIRGYDSPPFFAKIGRIFLSFPYMSRVLRDLLTPLAGRLDESRLLRSMVLKIFSGIAFKIAGLLVCIKACNVDEDESCFRI